MDRQQLPDSPEKPARRHTINVDTQLNTPPRYDFVLPSYSRDRRVSSITTTVPPETIINASSTNINISIPDQNSVSQERENTRRGIGKEIFLIYQKCSLILFQLL